MENQAKIGRVMAANSKSVKQARTDRRPQPKTVAGRYSRLNWRGQELAPGQAQPPAAALRSLVALLNRLTVLELAFSRATVRLVGAWSPPGHPCQCPAGADQAHRQGAAVDVLIEGANASRLVELLPAWFDAWQPIPGGYHVELR